jgi:hypothetical protein
MFLVRKRDRRTADVPLTRLMQHRLKMENERRTLNGRGPDGRFPWRLRNRRENTGINAPALGKMPQPDTPPRRL